MIFFSNFKKIKNNLSVNDLFIQSAIILFILTYLPLEDLFMNGPATGGDTGSHYYPLHVLKEKGWKSMDFSLKFWNAGNLFGEPLLVHYFPLPYILMGMISYIFDTAVAFNLVICSSFVLFPFLIFCSGKIFGFKDFTPNLMSIFSLFFLFDSSHSMLGGNIASILAGQFAHSLSLGFYILSIAFIYRELVMNESFPFIGIIFLSLTGLSHGYTFISAPLLFCGFLCLRPSQINFFKLFLSGIIVLCLTSFFIVPMIQNQSWTTPFSLYYGYHQALKIFSSSFFLIPLSVASLAITLIALQKVKFNKKQKEISFLFLILTFSYVLFYFIFPHIGLVDARSIPQIYIFVLCFFSICIQSALNLLKSSLKKEGVLLLIFFSSLSYIYSQNVIVKSWSKWNFSGWNNKPLSKDFEDLTSFLKGSLSDPRVVYENNMTANSAGSIRVFEMLPYFSQRSTLEGLYLQSTVMAPAAFFMQSLVSKTPSCPFINYKCPGYNLTKSMHYFDLFGVQDIIVTDPSVKVDAEKISGLKKTFDSGPWTVFQKQKKIELVEVLSNKIEIISNRDWRKKFYAWLERFSPDSNYLVSLADFEKQDFQRKLKRSFELASNECRPKVHVNYHGFILETQCLHRPHLVKFAFNQFLKPTNNSKHYLISPGYILIFPKSKQTSFELGTLSSWAYYNLLSLFTLILFLFSAFKGSFKRKI